jgi:hypothetical protein
VCGTRGFDDGDESRGVEAGGDAEQRALAVDRERSARL